MLKDLHVEQPALFGNSAPAVCLFSSFSSLFLEECVGFPNVIVYASLILLMKHLTGVMMKTSWVEQPSHILSVS